MRVNRSPRAAVRNWPIGRRLALMVFVGGGLIVGCIITLSYITTRLVLREEMEGQVTFQADALSYRIDTVQRDVAQMADGIAAAIETGHPVDRASLDALVLRNLATNPDAYGAAIAFAPNELGAGPRGAARYAYRRGSVTLAVGLDPAQIDFLRRPWFTLPRDQRHALWTEPYYDSGIGDIHMVTYSVPIRVHGRFVGVATCDVSLGWLTSAVERTRVDREGYAFLISATGRYISHGAGRSLYVANESIFSVAGTRHLPALSDIGRRMVAGETGLAAYPGEMGRAWVAFAPVPSTGWSVGLVYPEAAFLHRVVELARSQSLTGILGLLLLLVAARLISLSITTPLQQLEEATHPLAHGDLDAPLPALRTGDEVSGLATSFAAMRDQLKAHLAELAETTAAQERIASEIHIARSIQTSLVPHTFPPFPERREFSLGALLDPAREIGGDFYDYMLADEHTLFFAAADVSGKGIPAALFMAVTRTFLKAIVRETHSQPDETLRRLNQELTADNDTCMFVTMTYAAVDLPTGRCVYATGGHPAPILLRRQGSIEMLPATRGPLIGAMPGVRYGRAEVALAPGDTIFLYTDGVNEARNPAGEFLGVDGLLAALARRRELEPQALMQAMRAEVEAFSNGAEQSDDITMVAFRYHGPAVPSA